MARDDFLKFEGPAVEGESTDKAHLNWIEVLSFSYGVRHSRATVGGQAEAAANFDDFSIIKCMDRSSPNLFMHCARGTRFSRVVLEICRTVEGKQHVAMTITLEGVTISAFQPGGKAPDEGLPTESVSFCFGTIKIAYTPVAHSGSTGATTERGWDLKKNAPSM